MSAETQNNQSISEANLLEPSESLVLRLREILHSCSKSVEAGDISQSESLVSELVKLLDSVFEAAELDPDNEETKNKGFEVLSEVHRFMCLPSLDQAVIDALSFELPKAVAKLGGLSSKCLGIANQVIDRFIAMCSPRDMLSILCEALDSLCKMIKTSYCFLPILGGLSRVFLSIQRRHFEQLKSAVPVIVKVLKEVSSESCDEDMNLRDLYESGLGIAESMHAVCIKLEGSINEKLHALLGLYILQFMALVSVNMREKVADQIPLVLQLSGLLPQCGLSYLCLITGSDVDRIASIVVGEDDDDYISCLPDIKLGASLAVIWGHISYEVAQAAEEDLATVTDELRNSQSKRWQALGILKHIFSSVNLPWKLKKHAIDFLLSFIDGDVSRNSDDAEFSSFMPSAFAALKAVQMVLIYTSDSTLRKNAFVALKRILADIPTSQRFDILKSLITNGDSSSMVAILIDIVREEMRLEISQRKLQGDTASHNQFFWSPDVLELVELVLRPSKGGPPVLPEESDAVSSALNLYRFIFITESTGKTNFTGVLSKENLQKAYNEWLMPLRTLVTAIAAENKTDYDQHAVDTLSALNPIELVLYRVIELVEEWLKGSA